jgi:hypothetical protein
MRLSSIGSDIWIGEHQACGSRPFDLTIHIWQDENLLTGHVCPTVREGGEGLVIHWTPGLRLEDMSVPMADVADYICRDGTLLIHCAHGIARSSLLGVAALSLRSGCDPWFAAATVGRAVWGYARHAPAWPEPSWTDLIHFLEG